MGWGFIRVTGACARRKSVPSSSHTVLVPLDCPFHLGFMSSCTISMDYERVQSSWRDFSTPDFPSFNIYHQGQQSTDPDPVMRFILRFSTAPTSTQEPPSSFQSSRQVHLYQVCLSTQGPAAPMVACFRMDLQPHPLLPIPL